MIAIFYAVLIGVMLAGLAASVWVLLTGESVEHRAYHRASPAPRRWVLAGPEAVLRRDPEPGWG